MNPARYLRHRGLPARNHSRIQDSNIKSNRAKKRQRLTNTIFLIGLACACTIAGNFRYYNNNKEVDSKPQQQSLRINLNTPQSKETIQAMLPEESKMGDNSHYKEADSKGVAIENDNNSKEADSKPQQLSRTININSPPSKDTIQAILVEERKIVSNSHSKEADSKGVTIEDLAITYELVYALVASFQRNNITIVLGFGSHMGARRHHAIIPFGEKDVDLFVFSLDEDKVKSIINDTLQKNPAWLSVKMGLHDFGFNIPESNGFSHYIDLWMFHEDADKTTNCVGRNLPGGQKGCHKWYQDFHAKKPPVFATKDFLPPVYQIFGTHKVPIPKESRDLEIWQYSVDEHWNTTCGAHRLWGTKKALGLGSSTRKQWVTIPKRSRNCSQLYSKYPFVFKQDNGYEELWQNGVTIHRSSFP